MVGYVYKVIQIYLPEWETGEVIELQSFDDPESAFSHLDDCVNDDDCCHEVIIDRLKK